MPRKLPKNLSTPARRKRNRIRDLVDFEAVRFGAYDNGGSVAEYKAKGRFVVGFRGL
jgi:hypothetical protein